MNRETVVPAAGTLDEDAPTMPTPITANDALFSAIRSQVPSAFLGDVVDLINQSPNLLSEINNLDATSLPGGGTAVIQLQTGANNAGNTYYHAPVINIGALPSYDDSQAIYGGASLSAGQSEGLTPAGTFVGLIAHEIAHWGDPQIGPLYVQGALSLYPIEQAVATEFASEGKAAYSQYLAMAQIQASDATQPLPAGLLNGNILFNVTSNALNDTGLLQHVQALPQGQDPAAAVSYLGSQFWNVAVDAGTYLTTMWGGYSGGGAPDDLGILESQISLFQVTESQTGTLVGCTIETGGASGLTYQINCPTPGQQQAQVLQTSSQALLATIGTNIVAGGPMQLSIAAANFTFAVAAVATATVQGNGDTLSLSGQDSLDLNGTGETVNGGAGNRIHLAQGATGTLTGSNETVALAGSNSLGIDGSNNSVTLAGSQDRLFGAAGSSGLHLAVSGNGTMISLTAGTATISGANTTTTVFGGAASVNDAGGGGIMVMGSGATTVGGAVAGAGQTVFGGNGGVVYEGGAEYADVISGTGSSTIAAGSGGGWYAGGANGNNRLTASGGGTVLEAGGNGDTLTGAAGGGTYLLAGSGNETLNGGNRIGENSFFLGSGSDQVNAGAGGSVIVAATGSASITGGDGTDQIWAGSGGADLFTPGKGGTLEIHGFRVGTDHLATGSQSIASVVRSPGGVSFTLSSGATITLFGVEAQPGSVFV